MSLHPRLVRFSGQKEHPLPQGLEFIISSISFTTAAPVVRNAQLAGATLHLAAPAKYGSANGFPLETSSDVTISNGRGTPAFLSAAGAYFLVAERRRKLSGQIQHTLRQGIKPLVTSAHPGLSLLRPVLICVAHLHPSHSSVNNHPPHLRVLLHRVV